MQSEARKPAPVNPSRVVAKVEAVLGLAPRPVALHEPNFGRRERALVTETIDTGWVSSGGKFVERFEQTVARYVGARHGIAIVNGTAALHLALILAGVRPDDEVLVPTITFVATANAVRHANATPHFVDVSWKTLGIDAEAMDRHLQDAATMQDGVLVNSRTKRPIRAVVPMHAFGHPVEFDALRKVAAKYNLIIVEDAAEALGSQYENIPCGSLGLCAALSFNGNKIITTGGGGMIVTNDDALAVRARHISTTAKLHHAWEFLHDEVGYNYRLPNLNAALGCAQMERIDEFVTAKRNLAGRYIDAFAKSEDGRILAEPSCTRSNYWLNTLVLASSDFAERDAVLSALHAARILARPVWTPMHLLPMYKASPRAPLPVAEGIHRRCINLPSSAALAAQQ